jgi:Domain of unknown function (DUF397)
VDAGPAGELTWQQGRQCDSGACVEAARAADCVLLRSSTDPDGVSLPLSGDEWSAFIESVKDGLFDGL